MSQGVWDIETDIRLSKERAPIVFAHKKSIAHPEGYYLHLNDHIELYVYVSGNADYIVEDHYISLSRGDIVVILPHEVHVPVIKSVGAYERFYMLLPANVFEDIGIDPIEQFRDTPMHKITLAKEKREEFLHILYQISALASSGTSQETRLQKLGLFLQAQGMLFSLESNAHAEEKSMIASDIPMLIRNVLQYIGAHAQALHSVEEIAAHFYISPQYLSTLFKKKVGVNISHYLRTKKVALAKSCLEKGRSVAEACYESGFSDSSHFIRIFKEAVGATPKQYQNAFLKENAAKKR